MTVSRKKVYIKGRKNVCVCIILYIGEGEPGYRGKVVNKGVSDQDWS